MQTAAAQKAARNQGFFLSLLLKLVTVEAEVKMDFRGTEQRQTWLLKAEFGLCFEALKPRVGRMFGTLQKRHDVKRGRLENKKSG